MLPVRYFFVLAALALVNTNEAAKISPASRVKSKAEVMATMTTEKAVRVLAQMHLSQQRLELVSTLQRHFSHVNKKPARSPRLRAHARNARQGGIMLPQVPQAGEEEDNADEDSAPNDGDDDVKDVQKQKPELSMLLRGGASSNAQSGSASEMLNEMLNETAKKLEMNKQTCSKFDKTNTVLMETMQEDVASFNANAADARSRVLKAQGELTSLDGKIRTAQEEHEAIKKSCKLQQSTLKDELTMLKGDIAVMGTILDMIKCEDKVKLIQCAHCNNGEGDVMLQDDTIKPMLDKLKAGVVKDYLQKSLKEVYSDSLEDEPEAPVALTQELVEHLLKLRGQSIPRSAVNVSDVPVSPVVDCQPTNKCTIGSSKSCGALRDRFLVLESDIVDKNDDTEVELAKVDKTCAAADRDYKAQIEAMEERVGQEQTNLAVATKDQTNAEEGSHLKSKEHAEVAEEYTTTMTQCCDTINTLISENCALTKIRGEVDKLASTKKYRVDCELSDWKAKECSASCGGGTREKFRTILVQPSFDGLPCLPLKEFESCHEEPCPVDCQLGSWGGWSDCSAECGGGVIERARPVTRHNKYGGEPCGAVTETLGCNLQSCNKRCELSKWSAWSPCSKACGRGSTQRTRKVDTPASGTGKCWGPESRKRLQFKSCNNFNCNRLLPSGRKLLQCEAKTDLIILLDGSGSLRRHGWKKTKQLALKFVSQLNTTDDKIKVSLILFSGPKKYKLLRQCVGRKPGNPSAADCGITVEKHLTDNLDEMKKAVNDLKFPARGTLVSIALGTAMNEITRGREDASTVVLTVTDGRPYSRKDTTSAAKKLIAKGAKMVWVAVGRRAPVRMMRKLGWASKPVRENVITIRNFNSLTRNNQVNRIISTACSVVD